MPVIREHVHEVDDVDDPVIPAPGDAGFSEETHDLHDHTGLPGAGGLLPSPDASWIAETPVVEGDRIGASGKVFEATGDGTTDVSEPDWDSVLPSDLIADGSTDWKYIGHSFEVPFDVIGGVVPALIAAADLPTLEDILDENTDAGGNRITGLADPTDPQDAATMAYADTAGALTSVTIDLDADDIATLSSVPVQVVAAPGADKVIVPVASSFQYHAGDEPFGQNAAINLVIGEEVVGDSESIAFSEAVARVASLAMSSGASLGWEAAHADVNDVALELTAGAIGLTGSILTASVADGGAGYAEDDTITLTSLAGTGLAVLTVTAVDGGGAVTAFDITDVGHAYRAGVDAAQDGSSGSGTGFQADIETITPMSDGQGRLTVLYYVMDLLGGLA